MSNEDRSTLVKRVELLKKTFEEAMSLYLRLSSVGDSDVLTDHDHRILAIQQKIDEAIAVMQPAAEPERKEPDPA